jgi:hypothetical protein
MEEAWLAGKCRRSGAESEARCGENERTVGEESEAEWGKKKKRRVGGSGVRGLDVARRARSGWVCPTRPDALHVSLPFNK